MWRIKNCSWNFETKSKKQRCRVKTLEVIPSNFQRWMVWESHWNLSGILQLFKSYLVRNQSTHSQFMHITKLSWELTNWHMTLIFWCCFYQNLPKSIIFPTWRRHWHRIGHGHSGLHRHSRLHRLHGRHAHTRIAHRHGARHSPRHTGLHGLPALRNGHNGHLDRTLSKRLRSQPSLEAVATWKVKWILWPPFCSHLNKANGPDIFFSTCCSRCFQRMNHLIHVTSGTMEKSHVKSHAHHGFNGWNSSERLCTSLGDSVENSLLQTELGHVGVEDVLNGKTRKVRWSAVKFDSDSALNPTHGNALDFFCEQSQKPLWKEDINTEKQGPPVELWIRVVFFLTFFTASLKNVESLKGPAVILNELERWHGTSCSPWQSHSRHRPRRLVFGHRSRVSCDSFVRTLKLDPCSMCALQTVSRAQLTRNQPDLSGNLSAVVKKNNLKGEATLLWNNIVEVSNHQILESAIFCNYAFLKLFFWTYPSSPFRWHRTR